jgi:type IV fimbrial biogenesis protein FimT
MSHALPNSDRIHHSGFTLIELLVALAVLAILTGLAAPSFIATVRDNRLVTQSNEFIGALHLARSEAVKRSEEVVVCKSNDGVTCNDALSWADGWLVLADSGALVLRVGPALDGENTIFASSGLENRVIYSSRGMASVEGGTWQFCDVRGAESAHAVILKPSGRPKIAKTLHGGGNLTCL